VTAEHIAAAQWFIGLAIMGLVVLTIIPEKRR